MKLHAYFDGKTVFTNISRLCIFYFFWGVGGGGGGKSPRFSTVFWLLRNKVIFNCPNLSWYHEFFDPTHKILFVIVSASNERFNEHT